MSCPRSWAEGLERGPGCVDSRSCRHCKRKHDAQGTPFLSCRNDARWILLIGSLSRCECELECHLLRMQAIRGGRHKMPQNSTNRTAKSSSCPQRVSEAMTNLLTNAHERACSTIGDRSRDLPATTELVALNSTCLKLEPRGCG